jgi:hypothetical protein
MVGEVATERTALPTGNPRVDAGTELSRPIESEYFDMMSLVSGIVRLLCYRQKYRFTTDHNEQIGSGAVQMHYYQRIEFIVNSRGSR